jgi:hypothetical protein
MPVTQEYVAELPQIYREILSAFPSLEPQRKKGYALALQTLSSELRRHYSYGEIKAACEQLAQGGAVEIRNEIFVCPTDLGEELIEGLTGKKAPPIPKVPEFVPPK